MPLQAPAPETGVYSIPPPVHIGGVRVIRTLMHISALPPYREYCYADSQITKNDLES